MTRSLILAALAALTGCSGMSASTAPPSGEGRLEVVNATGEALAAVEASSCTAAGWGRDRLGGTLASGGRQVVRFAAGCWDLRARTGTGEEVVRRNVQIQPGESQTWTVEG